LTFNTAACHPQAEPENPIRTEIRRRHDAGQGWTEIAGEMGLSINSVWYHAKAIRRESLERIPADHAILRTRI
jgi:hypothetical protein